MHAWPLAPCDIPEDSQKQIGDVFRGDGKRSQKVKEMKSVT